MSAAESRGGLAADETGPAGDQNSHVRRFSTRTGALWSCGAESPAPHGQRSQLAGRDYRGEFAVTGVTPSRRISRGAVGSRLKMRRTSAAVPGPLGGSSVQQRETLREPY